MTVLADKIAQQVYDFLIDDIIEDVEDLDFNSNLLTEMDVDSVGMLRVVNFLENEYDITISPIYFTIENFQHITAISVFVATLIQNEKG